MNARKLQEVLSEAMARFNQLIFANHRIFAIKVGSASDVVGSALVSGLAGPFAPESDADKEAQKISK